MWGIFVDKEQSTMNTNDTFQAQMTVEDVLTKWPETWIVFKSEKTSCVGCFMQRFCSLQDVAETYQLPLQDLIVEMEKCVNQSNLFQRSNL